ncbi:hypothetical protein L2E82_20607 [Cichorium intybus]|uniref:Uncharacterized protein n=1 Tax=Cichorium intybus TaxID=13427 RepID=A0ACB9DU43_CICIN|nr:hypothetical protein L2E82_20607 [Cichorium intybus]
MNPDFITDLIHASFITTSFLDRASVLRWEDVEVPDPKNGEIRLKQKAIGLNYLDVYMRQGTHPQYVPFILGMEGMRVVIAVGPGVTSCKDGDVVACTGTQVGSYAQERILPADQAMLVPSCVNPVEAAAIIFKGITTYFLLD